MASGSGWRSTKGAKGRTGGRQTVTYRNAKGRTTTALVVAAGGGGNQLNLRLRGGRGNNALLTNVPKATAPHQTNVWY